MEQSKEALMAKITQTEIDEVIHFIVQHYAFEYTDYKKLYQLIAEHAAYDTLMMVRNKDEEIVAVMRWNILPNGLDAVILDLIIHPDYRNQGLAQKMTIKGYSMYPTLQYIIFERREKDKPFKKFPIKKFMNRRF